MTFLNSCQEAKEQFAEKKILLSVQIALLVCFLVFIGFFLFQVGEGKLRAENKDFTYYLVFVAVILLPINFLAVLAGLLIILLRGRRTEVNRVLSSDR